jgi:hypothetical protein
MIPLSAPQAGPSRLRACIRTNLLEIGVACTTPWGPDHRVKDENGGVLYAEKDLVSPVPNISIRLFGRDLVLHHSASVSTPRTNLFRTMRFAGNGHPNFRARSRIGCRPRLKAAQARISDAPWSTSAFSRSSSSGDHGLDIGASQCPKIIAPIVNKAAPIQIRTAALFSEMIGVGFMTK